MDIIRIAALALIGAILALTLKKDNPTGALLVVLGSGVVIFLLTLSAAQPVLNFVNELVDASGMAPAVIAPLVKTLGIAMLTKVAAETCKEAGAPAVGSYTEIAGGTLCLYVSLPLMSAVLSLVRSFL